MKKIFLMISILLLGIPSLMAQTDSETVKNKMFYMELGGPGIIMSANYDMRINPNSRLGLGFRVGAGFGVADFDNATGMHHNYSSNQGYSDYYPISGYSYSKEVTTHSYYAIPVQINYVLGRENSASTFEVGAGASFLTRKVSLYNYEAFNPGHFIGHLSFMYRLQPTHGGFSLRVGFTPIIGTAGDLFPMGAISLGYAF